MVTAKFLNDHLKKGGVVVVTNMMKQWVIEPKCGEFFKQKGDDLYMRRGKKWDCISSGNVLHAKIQTGYYK